MKKHINVVDFIFSLMFSFFIMISSKIVYSGNMYASLKENYVKTFSVIDIILFFILSTIIYLIMYFIHKKSLRIKLTNILNKMFVCKKQKDDKKNYVLIIMLFLIIMWMPYFLSFFPGSVLGDSLSSVYQALNKADYNNHFPIIYTLYIKLFLIIGDLFNNINIGIALYSLTQMCIMSFTIAYGVNFLMKNNVKKWAIFVILLFYGLSPFFGTYSIILWKDPIYSCAIALVTVFFIEHYILNKDIFSNTKKIICLVILLTIIVMFRSNGIFVVIGFFLILICCEKKYLKKLLLIFSIPVIFYISLSLVLRVKNIKNEFVESVGVPLQQIAYTISTEGYYSKDDRAFLYKILKKENWKKDYIPCLVDTIKWDKEFNSKYLEKNKVRFIKVWFNGLKNNFGSYVKAYLLDVLGYIKPFVQADYGYSDAIVNENSVGIYNTDIIKMVTNTSIKGLLNNKKIMLGSGTVTMIFSIICYILLRNNKKYFVIFIPCLLNLLTILIASPVAFSLRYIYCEVLLLPVILLTPLFIKKKVR